MVGLLRWVIGAKLQDKESARVKHQIRLALSGIHVQRSIERQR